ncbi:MAG: hypothetical protein HS129_03235 [Leptospiraceae bacterium]|nr:hypothetical protein [Leptospiraceae bacterium]
MKIFALIAEQIQKRDSLGTLRRWRGLKRLPRSSDKICRRRILPNNEDWIELGILADWLGTTKTRFFYSFIGA